MAELAPKGSRTSGRRSIKGCYVAVEPFHLDRWVEEQLSRWNNRKQKPVQRFAEAINQAQ
jgi:hypothetical protein